MGGKKSGRLAFGGIMTAMSLGCLLLTAVPVTEISLAALAGICITPVVIECGRKTASLSYLAVCLLSLLLVPVWEGKMLFITLFGYYPVIKSLLEAGRISRPVEWLIKLAVFNLSMIIAYRVLTRFLGLPEDTFTVAGISLPWAFLLVGNGVFALYDWCLTRLIGLYMIRWRSKAQRLFRF